LGESPAAVPVWTRHYSPGVPAHLTIPNHLLTEVVEESVRRWRDRTALVYYGAKWTYGRFWEESERFAAALAKEGVGPGDRVALFLPNCPAYPMAFFATLRLGATVVQVSPLYLGQDLVRILKDSEPKALVTLEFLYPNLAKVRSEASVPTVFVARLRELYPWYTRPFVNSVMRRQHLDTEFPSGPEVRPWTTAIRTPGSVPLWKGDPATTVAVLQYTGEPPVARRRRCSATATWSRTSTSRTRGTRRGTRARR